LSGGVVPYLNGRYTIAGYDQYADVQQVLYSVMGTAALLVETMRLHDL
jgi:hypothetical protein